MLLLKIPSPQSSGSTDVVSELNTRWLRTALSSAATKAGYHGWWLADHLAVGISTYLQDDYRGGSIDLTQLERIVQGVLCDVGYREVAVFFSTVLPSQRISLARCVRELPQNDRMEFFDALTERIRGLQGGNITHIYFSELQACVRNLLRIPPTEQAGDERHLMSDVVAFVRERVLNLGQQQEVWCSIT